MAHARESALAISAYQPQEGASTYHIAELNKLNVIVSAQVKQSSSAARTKHFWFTMWSKLRMFPRLWMSMRIMFKKLSYDCTCLIDLRTVPPRNLHLRQGSFYTKNASRANSGRIFGIKHIQNPKNFPPAAVANLNPGFLKHSVFEKICLKCILCLRFQISDRQGEG